MATINVPYVALLVAATPLLLASLYYALDNLQRRGTRPLVALLVGTLVWLLSALGVALAPSFEVGLFANRFQYVGITMVPIGFFLFALAYVDRADLVNRYTTAALLIEPIAVLALVWTNRSHDLWTTAVVPEGTTYVVAGAETTCAEVICWGDMGPAFLGHTVYTYALLLVGAALVLSRPIRSDVIPRGQAVSMAIAVGAPLAANALSLFVLPSGFPDLTPVAFGVTGVALVVGLYRYSLVETGAITGAAAIDERDAGAVLVVDDRVVEVNVEGARILGVDADTVIDAPIDEAFADHPQLLDAHGTAPGEITGRTITEPISGETVTVDVSTVDPDESPQTGWVYEFTPTD